jgi:hypothetical protein
MAFQTPDFLYPARLEQHAAALLASRRTQQQPAAEAEGRKKSPGAVSHRRYNNILLRGVYTQAKGTEIMVLLGQIMGQMRFFFSSITCGGCSV